MVFCVSGRIGDPEDFATFKEKGPDLPVFFTAGSPKRWYMEQQGLRIDVWIDDDPQSIVGGR